MRLRTRIARQIPPLVRRDEKIRALKAQDRDLRRQVAAAHRGTEQGQRVLEEAQQELAQVQRRAELLVDPRELAARASFTQHLLALRRTTVDLRTIDPQMRHPLRQLPFKLRNYRLAASHGVAVPTVLGVWSTPEEIDLDSLPDTFVLKSDGGAGSHGVLPLRREGSAYLTLDGERTLTAEQVREHFSSRLGRSVLAPFFAEEALRQIGGGPIPDDVKLYSTYGQVQQVLLRRVARHGDLHSVTTRYVRADGSDLGQVLLDKTPDLGIPVPDTLPEMVRIAEHLSRAVGLPFVRVDLFSSDRGVLLGELTRTPGGRQRNRADHDEAMGLAWEAAAYRLDLDLQAGRPPGVLHGLHEAANHYPQGHVSTSADPGPWEPVRVPCEDWCLRSGD